MQRKWNSLKVIFLLGALAIGTYSCGGSNTPAITQRYTAPAVVGNGAFTNHMSQVPDSSQYPYPLFQLSHNYPDTFRTLENPSWQQALKGQPIGPANAFAYMDSLKSYVKPHLLPFFTSNHTWSAADHGWFHEPWIGSEREPILGTYLGNGNVKGMFTSLPETETGYVLTLYDSLAAYTVGKIWGQTGDSYNLSNNAAQFQEGSVIVKLAFSNINYPQWPVMDSAQTFYVYGNVPTKADTAKGYQLRQVSFFQMDVIVKDSKSSPQTGWVYSTFVYDKDHHGTGWDKMVPLGAMWGNDPEVNSPVTPPYPKLRETVINKNAPLYSKETLGWGGRLSGPNDGAVSLNAADENGNIYPRLALSSCMSCHSPAQNPFTTSMFPGPDYNNPSVTFVPGSPKWKLWFRNNYGTVPFESGHIAMDYDMVMAFKSIGGYNNAHPGKENEKQRAAYEALKKFRQYHGQKPQ
ncbi:hypothetical protein [Chitinophaga sp. sic0106]|uniref:hypothetical protein n=1 Tax=Chitinophaga sp. sic0106 TaxID=2854785 RepID=UPI001C469EFD|nr:hypothetical protein [Chitinophaga sp. sic0106]MBV7531629.1 hypothetical protein [Chitinophaga sp. sic0106]